MAPEPSGAGRPVETMEQTTQPAAASKLGASEARTSGTAATPDQDPEVKEIEEADDVDAEGEMNV